MIDQALAAAEANISHVEAHLNVADLMLAASADPWNRSTSCHHAAPLSHATASSFSSGSAPAGAALAPTSSETPGTFLPPPAGPTSIPSRESTHGASDSRPPPAAAPLAQATSNKGFSREAIEAAAAAQGAKGG